MPIFDNTQTDMENFKITGGGAMEFSAAKPEKLGSSEYTLATIILDCSPSMKAVEAEIVEVARMIAADCKEMPRSESVMLRVLVFSNNVDEIHGFMPVNSIDLDLYDKIKCSGSHTSLYKSVFSGVGATIEYSKELYNNHDIDSNGAVYIVTDGLDNVGGISPDDIKDIIHLSGESIESIISILIAVRDTNNDWGDTEASLKRFKEDAELTEFIDAGQCDPKALAKIRGAVSASISSTSQSLGSGGPSQQLPSKLF